MEQQVQVGMQIERDVMIPRRDGSLMATDIYRPDNAGAAPLLLERTPYGKHLPSRSEITAADPSKALSRTDVAARFVARGIAVAYQDTRGRYNSEGVFAKYVADGADGFDAVQALAGLPGLDGRVGMFGLSYSAHSQVAAASMGPPALRAFIADSGGFSSAHRSGVRQGGAFELKQATWALKQARLSPEAAADPLLKAALEAEGMCALGSRACHGGLAYHQCESIRPTRNTFWTNGRPGRWMMLGSSLASMPLDIMINSHAWRRSICPAGMIPIR